MELKQGFDSNYVLFLMLGFCVSGFYYRVFSGMRVTCNLDVIMVVAPSILFIFVFPFLYYIDKHVDVEVH